MTYSFISTGARPAEVRREGSETVRLQGAFAATVRSGADTLAHSATAAPAGRPFPIELPPWSEHPAFRRGDLPHAGTHRCFAAANPEPYVSCRAEYRFGSARDRSDIEKVDDSGISVGDTSTSAFQPSACDTVSRTASRFGHRIDERGPRQRASWRRYAPGSA